MLIKSAVAAVLLYGALVLATGLFQRHLIYVPQSLHTGPDRWGAPQMQVVTLHTKDGLSLQSWYKPARNPTLPTVVYFHGNAGHMGGRVPTILPFMAVGYGVLLLEYRGYGPNTGTPSESGLYADGRAAVRFLTQAGIATRQMLFFGESLGAAVAIKMATEFRVAALVLQAPFTSLADIGKFHYPYLPVRLLLRDRYPSLERIAQVHAPVLILHARGDPVVPASMGQKMYDAAVDPKELRLYPLNTHVDLPEVAHAAMEFYQKNQ